MFFEKPMGQPDQRAALELGRALEECCWSMDASQPRAGKFQIQDSAVAIAPAIGVGQPAEKERKG